MPHLSVKEAMKAGLPLVLIGFLLDQATKLWAVDAFGDGSPFITVTPFFNLVLTFNTGVSFSMFDTDAAMGPYIFGGINILVGIMFVFWLRKAETKLNAIALGAIISGAFGNALDRFIWGGVVDFLDFHVAGYHWPTFNLADSFIVCGVGVLLFDGLFLQGKRSTTEDAKNA